MVDASLTPFVRAAARLGRYALSWMISSSPAAQPCRRPGPDPRIRRRDAPLQAAVRAEKSRDAENILKFCHWRQVERLIDALAADEPQGTVH